MLIMTKTQNYVIWLQGFLEACDQEPTEKQVAIIKGKLNDVFEHVAEEPKATIEEFGKTHGFPVYHDGITNHEPDDGVTYRC